MEVSFTADQLERYRSGQLSARGLADEMDLDPKTVRKYLRILNEPVRPQADANREATKIRVSHGRPLAPLLSCCGCNRKLPRSKFHADAGRNTGACSRCIECDDLRRKRRILALLLKRWSKLRVYKSRLNKKLHAPQP